MLHRFGHGLLVVLVACLCLMPARAGASTIELGTLGELSPGSFEFGGEFTFDNDIALIYFSLNSSAVVTAEMTSLLDDPAGFDPVLTLFSVGADFLGGWDWRSDVSEGFLEGVALSADDGGQLSAGNYLLAITQYNHFFFPGFGFEYGVPENVPFTYDLFAVVGVEGVPDTACTEFVALGGGCRSSHFAGTLSIEPENVQPVPEPGSLVLLMTGGAALLARRRHWRRSGASDVTEN